MKLQISESVLSQAIEDETVLMDIVGGQYFRLTHTAQRIWSLLQEHDDTEDVVAALATEYAVDHETLTNEVQAFAGQLLAAGLATSPSVSD